ncbi:MAG: hypothetical protein Q8M40_10505 [Legionella sp.]|nr:hypothetical protein [Legionella sp.]
MNKEFKQLLIELAKQSYADQKWILSQLPDKQREQFNRLQGDSLLKKAHRFRNVSINDISQLKDIAKLPAFCEALCQKHPLFIAIILEQGQFQWSEQFLETNYQSDEIRRFLNEETNKITPATRHSLFKNWQERLDFKDQMESING